MRSTIRNFLIGSGGAVVLAGAVLAQEATNPVAQLTDWSVFVTDSPKKMCWGVSAPKETVNTRDGRIVAARRGDILLFVTFQPGAATGEVSFTGGYPFKGPTVSLQIGDATFQLFTENVKDANGELVGHAWPTSAPDDAKVIASMKRGSEAIITAQSTRGTVTKDTFSLLGFTAAMEEAEKRCAG